jgi:hypothetical protein
MGGVQEAELENPFAVVSLSAVSSVRLDLSVEGVPGSALPSAIALMICTRNAVVAAALINVIRRRAANQFRKSGVLLVSQPDRAQKR